MGLVFVIEGIALPLDHPQSMAPHSFLEPLPGIPGDKSRVVLSLFPAVPYETGRRKEC